MLSGFLFRIRALKKEQTRSERPEGRAGTFTSCQLPRLLAPRYTLSLGVGSPNIHLIVFTTDDSVLPHAFTVNRPRLRSPVYVASNPMWSLTQPHFSPPGASTDTQYRQFPWCRSTNIPSRASARQRLIGRHVDKSCLQKRRGNSPI